jgi:RNA polymerase sigma-70 factor (ECF subfamily)
MDSINERQGETILVLLAQSGDIPAFEELLRRIHGPLRRYVINLAGESEADDVLQDVAFKIFRQLRQLREPKVFGAWTFRIATHTAFACLKRAKRWREVESDSELIRSPTTGDPSRPEELGADYLALIDRVSPASRAVLLLHYQQHVSLDEAAAILDIPVGTAKSRLSYGVATIRKFLKGEQS